jgi:DNA-directed RNA polymerase III subunit RPC3
MILDHGKLRPPDIIARLSVNDPKGRTSIQSYELDAHGLSFVGSIVYSQAFYKLVMSAYLKPSTVLSHVSPRDKRIKYEGEEKAKISGFPTAKELRQAKETAEARLKREEEEAEKVGLVSASRWSTCHTRAKHLVSQKRKATQQPGHRSAKVTIRFFRNNDLSLYLLQRKAADEEVVDVCPSFLTPAQYGTEFYGSLIGPCLLSSELRQVQHPYTQ